MSWFQSSPVDAEIEKATSEKNTTELWDVILTICDKVKETGASKDALRVIVKRLNHNDPHVVVQAITLLDSCVINCGKQFHLEVASREFETEFRKLLAKSEYPISMKLKLALKKWAEGDFKDDPQLDLIPSLYRQLKSDGQDFTDHTQPPKTPVVFSKDPNVVSSQQEEEDIAKAIELSLKETKNSPKSYSSPQSASLYPNVSLASSISSSSIAEARKVRALYDFEAAEDNELTFVAGEIIHVTDESDVNWWKGYTKKGEGLFPSNFVTADLSAEPESVRTETTKKTVQFSDEQKEKQNQIQLDIDENKIDRLLDLLNEANPEDPSQDSEEMLILENQVNQMGPLIDSELERVDRKYAQLTQLSGELVDAINLYHTLMRESDRPIPNMMGGYQQMGMYGGYQNNMFIPGSGAPGMNMQIQPGMMQQPNVPAGNYIIQNQVPVSMQLPSQQNGQLPTQHPQQQPQQNPSVIQMSGQFPTNNYHPSHMIQVSAAGYQLGNSIILPPPPPQQQQQQPPMTTVNGQNQQPHPQLLQQHQRSNILPNQAISEPIMHSQQQQPSHQVVTSNQIPVQQQNFQQPQPHQMMQQPQFNHNPSSSASPVHHLVQAMPNNNNPVNMYGTAPVNGQQMEANKSIIPIYQAQR